MSHPRLSTLKPKVISAFGGFFVPRRYIIWRGSRKEGKIALTFDDGPHPEFTPEILKVLRRYEAKATFFLLGSAIERNPDIVRMIAEEGHCIGNHTYSHARLRAGELETEVKITEDLIVRITGSSSRLFRPPRGELGLRVISTCIRNGLTCVLWSVDSQDWRGISCGEISEIVASYARSGDIILMHDDSEQTLHSLPQLSLIHI